MKKTDEYWMQKAVVLSHRCEPTSTAFCVGAIIVDQEGNEISSGYSRETEQSKHAEEIALERAYKKKRDLTNTTLYSSLEPCGERVSGKKTCVEEIIESGITRVVFGVYEPSMFVTGEGEELLNKAGIKTHFLATNEPLRLQ